MYEEDSGRMYKPSVHDAFTALHLLGGSFLNYAYFVESLRTGGLRKFFALLSREHVSLYMMSVILTKKNGANCINTIASFCEFHTIMGGRPFGNINMVVYRVLKDAYPWFKLLRETGGY